MSGGEGLNCVAASLLIAYYKFIPHACLSLEKSLSFVLCFRTMRDLLFCLNFLLEGRDEFFISYVHNAS